MERSPGHAGGRGLYRGCACPLGPCGIGRTKLILFYLCLGRALLLLGEVYCLALEHVQEGLRTLENLHVRGLSLLDGLVVLVTGLHLACEGLVDLGKAVRQDAQVL